MQCTAKHTKYDPILREWFCPKCGADEDSFVIDSHADGVSDDCKKLHEDDLIFCSSCDYESTGKAVARALLKKNSLVPCTCCKGTGFVKKE